MFLMGARLFMISCEKNARFSHQIYYVHAASEKGVISDECLENSVGF